MHTILSLAGLLASASAAEPAPAPTLCEAEEEIFFSCSVEGGKLLSLCGTAERFDGVPGVTYRFGRAGAVELAFPEDPASSATAFTVGRYTRVMLTLSGLKFTNAGVEYEIFDDLACGESETGADGCVGLAGVRVQTPEGQEVEIPCVGDREGAIMNLEGIVQGGSFWR